MGQHDFAVHPIGGIVPVMEQQRYKDYAKIMMATLPLLPPTARSTCSVAAIPCCSPCPWPSAQISSIQPPTPSLPATVACSRRGEPSASMSWSTGR